MDVGLSADGCAQLIWIVCLCWVILLSILYSFLNLQLLSFYVSSSFCSVIQPFSSCISSSSLFFFPPFPLLVHFHPSVTIATEERPSIEKGIRLAGPPSHLARRGGWGGGRSSGSMFELEALCPSTRHRSHSHSWPLTPFSFTLCPHRRSCEAAWECCATDFWPTKLYMARVSAALLCHYRASPFLLGDSIDTPS